MKTLAPIALFLYNRPLHTKAVLDALSENEEAKESVLHIFCDGSKANASQEGKNRINEVRVIAKNENRFKEVIVMEQKENKGLSASIISGVTSIVNKFGSIIVLEDDLIVSRDFLSFMNSTLAKYNESKQVACITGYVYPLKKTFAEAFFIKGADCWGWATWADKWKYFDSDANRLRKVIIDNKEVSEFTFNFSYPYFQMLEDKASGKNQSWAVLWYASAFVNNLLCLYPPHSLVQNIGNDGSGTHFTDANDIYNVRLKQINTIAYPSSIHENKEARKQFELFFKPPSQTLKSRIVSKLKRIYRKIIPVKQTEGWFGNYSTWEKAQSECIGYDEMSIPLKIKNAVLKVKSGEAKYERDSVLFNEIYLYQPIVSALSESIHNKKLHVCDFGGSLGSSYFQHRHLFGDLEDLKWSVIEQKHFVDIGIKEIQEKELKFFYTIDEALKNQEAQVLLLSSVLQYIKEPFNLIEQLLRYNFEYIIIDRTAFIDASADRLTKQLVPAYIYEASYPAWFFNESNFLKAFGSKYDLINQFVNDVPCPMKIDNDHVYWKGFYLRKKDA